VIAPQPFFTPRGTPFSVYHRTRVMAELGVEVDLLTYGEGDDVEIPGVRIIRLPRLRWLEPVPVGPSAAKALLDVLMLLWAGALLARRRYDFVHAHEEAVFLCLPLRLLRRFRLVYDMHSSLPQQLRNFRFTRSRTLVALFARLEDASLRRADAVITISPALARHAEARMPDRSRHLLIENSLFDPVRLRRNAAPEPETEPPELPDDRPIVVYAGTFEPYQGVDLLIDAFAEVRRRVDALLLLVGGAPEQVARERERASALGLDGDVRFTGRLPQEVARRLVGRAAVACSPRRPGSNTPLKVYELLALGVPLVATRITAHTQVLDDSVCRLAEPEPAALAAAIVEALADAEDRRRRAAAGRRLYEERYSRAAYVAKVGQLLRWLEPSRGRGSG
jgi:glycosyltransferase involved in cell wall biosynthesis